MKVVDESVMTSLGCINRSANEGIRKNVTRNSKRLYAIYRHVYRHCDRVACSESGDIMNAPQNIWTRHARRVQSENRKKLFGLICDAIALIAIGFIFGALFVALPILTQGV